MLWEILEARDSARVNRINVDGAGDVGNEWARPGGGGGVGPGDRPMMLGKDTASRGTKMPGNISLHALE